jgi:amino acid transporter
MGHAGYVIVSLGALLATASGVNAWLFSAIKIALALARAGQLPRIFNQSVWRGGTRGALLAIGGILLVTNLFDLSALARISSATFLITYLAVHIAHWRLIDQTRGSRWLVAIGFVTMAAVLGSFLWTSFVTTPWSIAAIATFVGGSWLIEVIVMRKPSDKATASR